MPSLVAARGYEARDQLVTSSVALLRAAEAGGAATVAVLARELAGLVLAAEPVRLAFEVMAGGPFVVAKAIELASVLAAMGVDEDEREASG